MKHKGFALIFIIISVVVLLGIAYFLGVKKLNLNLQGKSNSADSLDFSPSVTAEPTIAVINPLKPKPGSKIFFSKDLGIAFYYTEKDSGYSVVAEEHGNKAYVYVQGPNANYASGQWVEIFTKKASQTLKQAVEERFLKGIDSKDCFVAEEDFKNSKKMEVKGIKSAEIKYPLDENSETPFFEQGIKCPKDYSMTNGMRYFLMDEAHPTQFAFFDIGQYGISSNTSSGSPTWQDTIVFLR